LIISRTSRGPVVSIPEEESHQNERELIKQRILGKGVEDTGGDYVSKDEEGRISPKNKVFL